MTAITGYDKIDNRNALQISMTTHVISTIMSALTNQESQSFDLVSQAKQTFILYCETGDLNQMRRLVSLYPNCFSNRGVYIACMGNHYSVLKYITSVYRDRINIIADRNQTLSACCICGYDRVVEFLLSVWESTIGSIIHEEEYVISNAHNYGHRCLAILLRHYPDLLDAHIYPRSLGLSIIMSACKNGWDDVVKLTSPSYKRALLSAEIGSIDEPLEEICKQRWPDILEYILADILDVDHRQYLVRLSMQICIDSDYYDEAGMLVEKHMADIQYEPVSMICRDCCIGTNLTPEMIDQRHTFIDRLINTVKHTFEPDVWLSILKHVCTHGCSHLLNRLASDLNYAINTDTHEGLIREVVAFDESTGKCTISAGTHQGALTLYIKLFGDHISTLVIQSIFERAYISVVLGNREAPIYFQKRQALLPGLLSGVGSRLNLGPNAPSVLMFSIQNGKPNEIIEIMLRFRGLMPRGAVGTAVKDTWNSHWNWIDAKSLIQYCGQTEDAHGIISYALGTIKESTDRISGGWYMYQYSSLVPPAKERVSYILNYYFEHINLALMKRLFSMPSSVVYELLDVDGVKTLIDDHKYEEGCDEVIKLLDPNHENTTYVLLDYGIRGIKAAGFE